MAAIKRKTSRAGRTATGRFKKGSSAAKAAGRKGGRKAARKTTRRRKRK